MAKEVRTEFEFRGGRVDSTSVEKAFALSEEVMLKASVPIAVKCRLIPD